MNIENSKVSNRKQLEDCRIKANGAIDLAVNELIKTRGRQIVECGDEQQFVTALSGEKTLKRLKNKIDEYLKNSGSGNYRFEETGRQERVGNIRSTDLVIAGHLSSETLERFIVVDLRGKVYGGVECSSYVRFEAWCRLYYLPRAQKWYVHYVDVIIRHKSPARRVLFMFEYMKSGDVKKAMETGPDSLCLFFESPQGGIWG